MSTMGARLCYPLDWPEWLDPECPMDAVRDAAAGGAGWQAMLADRRPDVVAPYSALLDPSGWMAEHAGAMRHTLRDWEIEEAFPAWTPGSRWETHCLLIIEEACRRLARDIIEWEQQS